MAFPNHSISLGAANKPPITKEVIASFNTSFSSVIIASERSISFNSDGFKSLIASSTASSIASISVSFSSFSKGLLAIYFLSFYFILFVFIFSN